MDSPEDIDGAENSALSALNRRQLLFVLEYARKGIGSKAAVAAGYSEKSAEQQASTLLADPKVSEALAQIDGRALKAAQMDVDKLCAVAAAIVGADPAEALDDEGRVLPLKEWPYGLRLAMSGMDVEELWEGRHGSEDDPRRQVGIVSKPRFHNKNDAIKTLLTKLGALQGKGENSAVNFYELVLDTQTPKEKKA